MEGAEGINERWADEAAVPDSELDLENTVKIENLRIDFANLARIRAKP